MQYRRFGATELNVSEVGFGCVRLGAVFGGISRAEQVGLLRRAFEHGINFFDTADMYSQGESEALLGEAFRKDRDNVVIASKVGYCLPAQKRIAGRIKPLLRPLVRRLGLRREQIASAFRGAVASQDFSPSYIVGAVERSLKRLRTDYLDVYQLHSPPVAVLESGEFLEPLERLKRQGKVRHYGVACELAEDALVCLRYPEISSIQIAVNLIDQRALDEILPLAAERQVAIIARQAFASGLLAKPLEALALDQIIADPAVREARQAEIDRCHRIAQQHGRPLPEMALHFVLGAPGVSVTLLGMRTDEHLADNLRHLAAPPLSEEELRALRAPPAPVSAGSRPGATSLGSATQGGLSS